MVQKVEKCFFYRGFVVRKMGPYLFMSKTVIWVVYVDGCLFLERSKLGIDKVVKSFKEDGTSYNLEHSKGESKPDILGIDIKTLNNGGF